MKYILTIVFTLLSLNIFSQTHVIGKVTDESGKPIEVFDVRLFNKDSIFIKGSLCKDGVLSLEVKDLVPKEYKILIHAIGYKDKSLSFQKSDSICKLGTVILQENTTELSAVIVKAQQPIVKMEGDAFIINVAKTPLSEVGTYTDIMRRIPGIIVSGRGNVSVMGKQRLLVHLNGKELKDNSLLNILQSKKIKSITVDNNPGPSFSASYDAIIDVQTLPDAKDNLLITPANTLTIGRELSNSSSVVLNGKLGKFSCLSDISFATDGLRQNDYEEKKVWNNEEELNTFREVSLTNRDKSVKVGSILDYDLTPKANLGISYRWTVSNSNLDKLQNFSNFENQTIANILNKTRRFSHTPTIFYRYFNKNVSLSWVSDLYSSTSKSDQDVTEANQNTIPYNYKDKYTIWGSKIDFTNKLSIFNYTVGIRLSKISDNSFYTINSESFGGTQTNNIFSSYLSFQKKIKLIWLNAGIRYENERQRYKKDETIFKSTQENLFPYFSASYSYKIRISTSYAKRIYRPTYSQIISKVTYIDPISYSTGNPLLKPTIVDLFTISFQKKTIISSISYEYYTNKKAQVAELDENQAVRFTYNNIPHSQKIKLNIIYGYSFCGFKGNSTLMLSMSKMKFNGICYSEYKDIGIYFKNTIERSLWTGSNIMLNFWYLNSQYNDTYKMKESINASLTMSQYLLKKSLLISLSAEDIFHSQKSNNWLQKMSQSQIRMQTDADTRLLLLRVQYNWGKNKKRINASSSISEDINRL